MSNYLSVNNIRKTFMLICLLSFYLFAKPGLYVCKHVQFLPDSSCTQFKNSMVIDTITSYLKKMFSIDSSSMVDENILFQYHLGYKTGQSFRLPQEAHCSAKYFLCVTAKMTTEFRTEEDKQFFIPSPMPGGAVMGSITIKDEQPEYHFSTELSFAFYRTSDGKRVVYWEDQEQTQDDSADCSDCIPHTISEISENIYKKVNSHNPVALYLGAYTGMLTLVEWYNSSFYEDVVFGSGIGISGKLLFRNIFGIDASFSHHCISSKKYTSNNLYAGPCFGFKMYTNNRLFNFLYPNGSIGVTTFWNKRNKVDIVDELEEFGVIDSVKGALPVVAAFSGKLSILFCFKPFPLSLEPNLKLIFRPAYDDGIVGYDFGIRIGICRDFKKIN